MTRHTLLAAASALTLTLGAATAWSQTPMPDPLDDRSVRRLEKMEKVVRELRSIVFQGRDSGKPVVVMPAETDTQIQALTDRVADHYVKKSGTLEFVVLDCEARKASGELALTIRRVLVVRHA